MDLRQIIAAGETGWSPGSLNPLAWWYASTNYANVTGSGTVSQWSDRSGNGNTVAQTTVSLQPTWDTTSWGGRPVLTTNSLESLSLTSGSVLSRMNGDDIAFSVFATFRIDTIGSNVLTAWDHTTGAATSVCRCDNPGSNVLRYDREDDASASASVSSPGLFATGAHTRASYSFSGTVMSFFLNGNAAGLGSANVGTQTFNRFRLFDGPGASDSFDGALAELVVLARTHSAAEAAAYYAYSLTEWA